MQLALVRDVIFLVSVLLLAGCKTATLGPYISPRVEGQVIAADTKKPLAEVQVSRGQPAKAPVAGWSPKGGELLLRKSPLRTDPEGRFALQSERVLSVVRGSGWDRVWLSFQRAGYELLRTNYSTLTATNQPNGEPVLDIGLVLLRPTPKNGD